MDTIGEDKQIYKMFMQMIRIVFEATPYPSLCSLRVDVLMNFHDLDYTEVRQDFHLSVSSQGLQILTFTLDSSIGQLPSIDLVP